MLLGCVLFVVVLLLYCAWRWRRWKCAVETYGPAMPPKRQLSWAPPRVRTTATRETALAVAAGATTAISTTVAPLADYHPRTVPVSGETDCLQDLKHSTIAAAADGALLGFLVADAFSQIDSDVLSAIEFSTADHLNSLGSINDYVEDRFFDDGSASAEGWLHRLEGYVAEQKTAVALEKAGHVIEFAPAANTEGWDLLVDGQPWQVKEGVGLAGINEALSNHPEIPIATGSDLAGQIDHPMVHGFQDLDHHEIAATTKDSLSGIQEGFDPGFHVPVITVVRSSWRELKLLYGEKTTWSRALGSVAVDAAGVGVGGFAGAKLGAAIGAFGGPIGAAIGGALGGIVGAITGGAGAHAFRYKDFKRACEAYEQAYASAKVQIDAQIDLSRSQLRLLQGEYQQRYVAARSAVETRLQAELLQLQAARKEEVASLLREWPRHLRALRQQLEREESSVVSTKPRSPWWRLLVPGQNELQTAVIRKWFQNAYRRLDEAEARYLRLDPSSDDERLAEIRNFLTEYYFDLEQLDRHLEQIASRLKAIADNAEHAQELAARSVAQTRNSLIREFGDRVTALQTSLAGTINNWCESLKRTRDWVRREAEPLGVTLP